MIAVRECLRFWGKNSLAIILWKPKNLEYVVTVVKLMVYARLNGVAVKKEKKILVVSYAILMMTV